MTIEEAVKKFKKRHYAPGRVLKTGIRGITFAKKRGMRLVCRGIMRNPRFRVITEGGAIHAL